MQQNRYDMEEMRRKNVTPQRRARIVEVLSMRRRDLTVVLANIHDQHNVSAVYRSCDAFGVAEVHLYYTDTPFPPLGRKSSASARKWVDSVRHRTAEELAHRLRTNGYRIVAANPDPKAISLYEWNFSQPTAVILGNEHRGVDKELVEYADGALYIPMYGMVRSLNVSVAAAVILAEAARQRALAGGYAASRRDGDCAEKLHEWLEK